MTRLQAVKAIHTVVWAFFAGCIFAIPVYASRGKALKVRPKSDGVEVSFANPLIEKTAAEHHFGELGFVGKTKSGTTVRTRYPARRLLGFGRNDPGVIMDLVLDHVTGG